MKTDAQLKEDVNAELLFEPSVNATEIGVEVKDGVVTLAGEVSSFAQKWDAERAAQRVGGIKGLAVEISVNLPGASRRNDADIASMAQNALHWMISLPEDAVKVMVEDGWVTLTGEVNWDYQRQAAKRAVRHMRGVTGVSDQITLKSNVSVDVVKADIEAALKRRATTLAQKIAVDIKGEVVTLSGPVSSWGERAAANNSAWSAPGVRGVIDKMSAQY